MHDAGGNEARVSTYELSAGKRLLPDGVPRCRDGPGIALRLISRTIDRGIEIGEGEPAAINRFTVARSAAEWAVAGKTRLTSWV